MLINFLLPYQLHDFVYKILALKLGSMICRIAFQTSLPPLLMVEKQMPTGHNLTHQIYFGLYWSVPLLTLGNAVCIPNDHLSQCLSNWKSYSVAILKNLLIIVNSEVSYAHIEWIRKNKHSIIWYGVDQCNY